MKIIVIFCLIVVITLLWYFRKHRQPQAQVKSEIPAPKRIDQRFECPEGRFSISGVKDDFTISKDDRFTFHVKSGRIVSVVDCAISDAAVSYGGNTNVDI